VYLCGAGVLVVLERDLVQPGRERDRGRRRAGDGLVDPVVDRERAVNHESCSLVGDGGEGVSARARDIQVAAPAHREMIIRAETGRAAGAAAGIDRRIGLQQRRPPGEI
jgi:hypothetical protein